MSKIRWKEISIIFQGAMNALNPVQETGKQIAEPIQLHEGLSEKQGHGARARALRPRRHQPEARHGLPAPALRRHAPARHDRHGAGLQPQAGHRRRAHHGARRHGAGADPRAHRAPAQGARPLLHPHQPRPLGDGRDLRQGRHHVRRRGRRERHHDRHLQQRHAPLHAPAHQGVPQHPREARDGQLDQGRPAQPHRPAAGLRLLPALRREDRELRDRAPGAGRGRARATSCAASSPRRGCDDGDHRETPRAATRARTRRARSTATTSPSATAKDGVLFDVKRPRGLLPDPAGLLQEPWSPPRRSS